MRIEYLRDGLVEEFHEGLFMLSTEPYDTIPYYLRSCAKPLQATLLIDYGIDLTEEELALCCGSHAGEECHIRVAKQILDKFEIDEKYLKCGVHAPLARSMQDKMLLRGEEARAIHNNCSEMRLIKYVEILWQLGLVVVAAAGNNGPDIGSITVPGVSKKIITVGVVEDGKKVNVNGRYTSNYSGRGPTCECIQKPDLIAYGNNIVSCNNNYKLKKYTVKSGTSMATPVVTGCAALLLSKYPELKNIDVKRKMIESCKDVNLPANIQGAGVINPVELLSVK